MHQLNAMAKTGLAPELYTVLGLSQDQFAKLSALVGQGDPRSLHDQALNVLSASQKATVQQFEKAVRPPQGGGPDGGGPGGDGGPQ